MISFIVIGKNEERNIGRTINSIYDVVHYMLIAHKDYEIIFVDSKSTDDTVKIVKNYRDVKVFQITGKCNAAIGRNIGAKESSGDILFFIDGDMELIPEGVEKLFNIDSTLIYPFISGQYENYIYDINGLKRRNIAFENPSNKYHITTGGLFLIEKTLWLTNKGMKNYYTVNEDMDFGLRVSNKLLLLRVNSVIANHHTTTKGERHTFKQFLSQRYLYASLLYKENIFNKNCLKIALRNDYSLICLIIVSLMSITTKNSNYLFIYGILLLTRTLIQRKKNIFKIFFYYLLRDIYRILGIFLFSPKTKIKLEYVAVQRS